MSSTTKLTLGSVQFGCHYGISNISGQVKADEVVKLLTRAQQAGISAIDTASSYGESEKILGCYKKNAFDYLGKISPECKPENYLTEAKQSLKDLNSQRFKTISVHHGSILLSKNGDQNFKALEKIKSAGYSEKIGCSVYSPEEAITLLDRYPLDTIQLPASIFDQRIFSEYFAKFIKHKSVSIHIRSLFLQGALFLKKEQLPKNLAKLASKLEVIEELCLSHQISKLTLAYVPFVNNSLVDKIIIGCLSKNQLEENIQAYNQAKSLNIDVSKLAVQDDVILNPSKW